MAELERGTAETQGRVLNSVFFGGGTPSLMAPETVAALIDAIRGHWPCANDLEITLEANPGSVEAGRFEGYRAAGVNRVSMGIQALNDRDLRRLGRLHTAKEALKAFDIARTVFDRVSFDLIYARQDQSLADWEKELKLALTLAVDHLSLYQLTIEQGTAFGDRYNRGRLKGLPDYDLGADLFDVTQEICGAAGMPAYEVSNHARDGARSRHNLIYWRYGDYLGLGPGAHGRLTLGGQRYAVRHRSNPEDWLSRAHEGQTEHPRELLAPEDQAAEFLLMGLRLREGVDLRRFESLAGRALNSSRIEHLAEIGVVTYDDGKLIVTNQGFKVLNSVLNDLLSD